MAKPDKKSVKAELKEQDYKSHVLPNQLNN
jgi:hypothetical protein